MKLSHAFSDRKKRPLKLLVATSIVLLLTLFVSYREGKVESDCDRPTVPVMVYKIQENRVVNIDLENYVVGVVLAEMPAYFHTEALKAQAVCARTYALYQMEAGWKRDPTQPVILYDQPELGQGYVSAMQYVAARPGTGVAALERVMKAVYATKGEVITWNGKLINPLYHSTCGGATESALDVWGVDVPYLQTVTCPYDEDSPYHQQEFRFGLPEFEQRLGIAASQPLSLGETVRNKSGRVVKARINNKVYLGTELRERLGLPSTNFQLNIGEQGVSIITRGYGHGIGMCQYGANGLAQNGWDYRRIIKYYFKGVEVKRFEYNSLSMNTAQPGRINILKNAGGSCIAKLHSQAGG